jgi:hypothetical protein
MAICFVVDHTTAVKDSPQPAEIKISMGTEYKPWMREGAVPTALILGIQVYITFVNHLCTSFWDVRCVFMAIVKERVAHCVIAPSCIVG